MDPGKLNKLGTLQKRDPAADTDSAPVWIDHAANVWAAVRPLSSRELLAAQAVQGETTHEITLRYRSDVTAAMRYVLGSRVFDLGPPINRNEANQWLVIPATEGMTNG